MTDDPFTIWVFAQKLALNLAALLAIGLAAQSLVGVISADERPAWRSTLLACGLAILTLAGLKFVLAVAQLGGDLSALSDPGLVGMVAHAHAPGLTALAAGAGLIAVGGLFRARIALGLGGVVLAAGYTLGGHTRALESPGILPSLVALHVMTAGFWLAAPLTLWPREGVSDARLAARLERFGAAAVWAIPLLFAAGLWLAWGLAGGVDGLLGSTYGRLLLAKLAVAGLALGIGAANKLVVAGAVARDGARGRRLLRFTLGLDVLLFTSATALISAATSFVGPPNED